MRRQLLPALVSMIVFSVLLGLVYPLVVTGIAQVAFNDKANGSVVEVDGEPVGSSLMGQAFTDAEGTPLPEYFQSRPSVASGADGTSVAGYDPTLSLGSNMGPTNPCLVPIEDDPCLDDAGEEIPPAVVERVAAYRELNGLDDSTPVHSSASAGSTPPKTPTTSAAVCSADGGGEDVSLAGRERGGEIRSDLQIGSLDEAQNAAIADIGVVLFLERAARQHGSDAEGDAHLGLQRVVKRPLGVAAGVAGRRFRHADRNCRDVFR